MTLEFTITDSRRIREVKTWLSRLIVILKCHRARSELRYYLNFIMFIDELVKCESGTFENCDFKAVLI